MNENDSGSYIAYKNKRRKLKKAVFLTAILMFFIESAFILSVYIFYPTKFNSNFIWLYVVIPIVVTLIFILKKEVAPDFYQNRKTYGRGAAGEFKVGEYLEKNLGSEFKIVHNVPNNKGNIDHIVIGPGGVYAIETKGYSGWINYRDGRLYNNKVDITSNLKQAFAEAKYIEDLTEGKIKPIPVLTVAHAKVQTKDISGPIQGVWVCQLNYLQKVLLYNKNVLTPEQVYNYYDVLITIKNRLSK